nr:MAG TPA: hypothetical protein [Caudoviricetes sp.]
MIYVNKKESIIKIEGTKKECLSDIYNIVKGCISSGIHGSEIAKVILTATMEVANERSAKNEHRSN